MTVDRAAPIGSAHNSGPSHGCCLRLGSLTHNCGDALDALPPEAGRGLVDIDDKTSGYPHVHS